MPARTLLHACLTAAVFLVFGSLCLRHVGDSYFLADQVDQLQNFERLLQFHPYGLWGPIMSGTDPPARALGPLAAVLFGIPMSLGLGADAVHVVTSLLLVAATLTAFLSLARTNLPFAWSWLTFFVITRIVWWNAAMLWANTVLLPAGCVLLALMAACLRSPSLVRFGALVVVLLLAAQVHLVALAAAAPIALIAASTWRSAYRQPPGRAAAAGLIVAMALALGPYMAAEGMTKFANTRAILGHLTAVHGDNAADGRASSAQILQEAADPSGHLRKFGVPGWMALAFAAFVALASLLVWGRRLRGVGGAQSFDSGTAAIRWLTVASVIGIAGQAVFFMVANRPLLGLHYVAILAPLYVIPPAALLTRLVEQVPDLRHQAAATLGAACLALLVWRGSAWADAHWERTEWTYTRIINALDALCDPGTSARTAEGPGFAAFTPGYDPVLRYLMTRQLVACRHDPASQAMLVASREGVYAPLLEQPDGKYHLVTVGPPGIALYRRGANEE